MRMFLVGVLSATLIGCSCPTAPQAMLEACTSKPCFYRTAGSPPIELKPTPFQAQPHDNKSGIQKTRRRPRRQHPWRQRRQNQDSPQTSNGSDKDKSRVRDQNDPRFSAPPPQPVENAKTCRNEFERRSPGPASKPSDPILEKAKATVASKMEDPASGDFEDMNRAVRHDTFGQSIDTICGHVRGKIHRGQKPEKGLLYIS